MDLPITRMTFMRLTVVVDTTHDPIVLNRLTTGATKDLVYSVQLAEFKPMLSTSLLARLDAWEWVRKRPRKEFHSPETYHLI